MKKFIIAATVLFSFSVISAQEKGEKNEKGIKTEKPNKEKYDALEEVFSLSKVGFCFFGE